MQSTETLAQARRQMTICNACRYCESLCAVFPAMELRRTFSDGDLEYLANLCHGCGACHYDCQYAPPHEFAVNIPSTFAALRAETYARYAWPRTLAPVFARNGLAVSVIAAVSVAVFTVGFIVAADPQALFASGAEAGAFYRVMPHEAMVVLFGAAFLYAVAACWLAVRAFARASDTDGVRTKGFWRAAGDAALLRYLDGGGGGCMNEGERPNDRRRLYHHATFYGFLLCFASTCVATLFHYGLGWVAPYSWYSPPVLLGTAGGIGLLVGPWGLLMQERRRDPALGARAGMDIAFIAMLFLTGLTGLVLLALRATPAMGLLLALHLGVVFALFLSAPYGKFVHALYRFAALMRYAREQGRNH